MSKRGLVHTGKDLERFETEEAARVKKRQEDRAKGLDRLDRFWIPRGETKQVIFLDKDLNDCVSFYEHQLKGADGKFGVYEICPREVAECPVCAKFKESSLVRYYSVLVPKAYKSKEGKWVNKRELLGIKVLQLPTFKKVLSMAQKKHGTLRGVMLNLERGNEEQSASIGMPVEFEETGTRFSFVKDLKTKYGHPKVVARDGKTVYREADMDITPFDYEAVFPEAYDVDLCLKGLRERYGEGARVPGSAEEVADEWEAETNQKTKKRNSRVMQNEEQESWAEVGSLADQGEEDSVAQMEEAAAEHGVDPNEYDTWEQVGEYLDTLAAEAEVEEETWEAQGAAIDDDPSDTETTERIIAECEALELDPNDYTTWAEVGAAIDAASGEGEEEEEEDSEEEEEEEEDETWGEMGARADDGDTEAIDSITEEADAAGIDPNDYATWAEVGEALDSRDTEPGEVEESEEAIPSFSEIGADADEGDEDAINTLTEECSDRSIDPNDYATWAEVGEALDSAEEEIEDEADTEVVELWADIGVRADGGDSDSIEDMTAACETAEIDPNDYATWAEVGEALDKAENESEEEEAAW